MLPRKKNQSLEKYAEAAGLHLSARAQKVLSKRGANAAWEVIFKEICNEGQNMREVSPSGIVIYGMYIVVAATFLKDYPDKKKLVELLLRAREDIDRLQERIPKMKPENFTPTEYTSIIAAMAILAKTIKSLA